MIRRLVAYCALMLSLLGLAGPAAAQSRPAAAPNYTKMVTITPKGAFVLGNPRAKVRLVSGVELEGTVRHLARKASDKTRTFALEVDLPNPDGAIPSGMTAEVRLTAAAQPALMVFRATSGLAKPSTW